MIKAVVFDFGNVICRFDDYVNDFLDVPGVLCFWCLWIYRCFGVIMVFREWFWIYREM